MTYFCHPLLFSSYLVDVSVLVMDVGFLFHLFPFLAWLLFLCSRHKLMVVYVCVLGLFIFF